MIRIALKSLLGVIVLASLLLSVARARVGDPRLPATIAASGSWGVPGDGKRETRNQRWKVRLRIERDGSITGSGRVRVGSVRGDGNVVGRVEGHQLSADLMDDEGRTLATMIGALTTDGIKGAFITIAGDIGFVSSGRHRMRSNGR